MKTTTKIYKERYRKFVELNEEHLNKKYKCSSHYDTLEKLEARYPKDVYVTHLEMQILLTRHDDGISTIVSFDTLPREHVKYDAHKRPLSDFCKTFTPENNKLLFTGYGDVAYKHYNWCSIIMNTNRRLLTLLSTEEEEYQGRIKINGKEVIEDKDFNPIRVLDIKSTVDILLLNGFDVNIETEDIFFHDLCYGDTGGRKINITAERPYKIEKSFYDIQDEIWDFWDYYGTNAEEISIVEVDGLLYFELSDKGDADGRYNLSYGVMHKDFIIAGEVVPLNGHLYEQRIYEKNCKNATSYKIDDFLKNVYKEKKFED